jgi:hypothetical protein
MPTWVAKQPLNRHYDMSALCFDDVDEGTAVALKDSLAVHPTLPVVPLIYRVEDHRLYQVNEQWIQPDATGGDEPHMSSELTVP